MKNFNLWRIKEVPQKNCKRNQSKSNIKSDNSKI